jgi:preprotein translocase subunit SecE
MFEGFSRFLQEVRGEMQKVTWLSKPELISSTIMVLIATMMLSVFISLEDNLFEEIIKRIMNFK